MLINNSKTAFIQRNDNFEERSTSMKEMFLKMAVQSALANQQQELM